MRGRNPSGTTQIAVLNSLQYIVTVIKTKYNIIDGGTINYSFVFQLYFACNYATRNEIPLTSH